MLYVTIPVVGSWERTAPLMLTVWMLEKSEKIPVPGALVVWKQHRHQLSYRRRGVPRNPVIPNHLEAAATSVGRVDGEGEPHDWRADRLVHGSFALPVVEDVIEDELGLVVAGVDNRTHLDGQADGGCAALHRDVRVFFNREEPCTTTDLASC